MMRGHPNHLCLKFQHQRLCYGVSIPIQISASYFSNLPMNDSSLEHTLLSTWLCELQNNNNNQ